MSSLQGSQVKNTFKNLMQVSNSNSGVDSSLRYVSDGEGTTTPLELSTTEIRLNGQLWPSSLGNEGQVLTTHSDGTLYFADPSGGGATNLNSLTDVTITGVAASNVLQYDGAAWVNLSLAGAGISAVGHTHTASNITDLATATVTFSNKSGNISQWTNDSGYATATSSTAFSNKTGNISQWTNDSGYLTTNTALCFKTIAVSGQSDVVADSITDTLTLVAGTNVTITTDATTDSITINSSAGSATPTIITVANEGTDTTCFPAFFTAATGDLGPKTNASLTFNSNTATLACTSFSGALTGNVTGNVSGSSGSCTGNSATVTTNANLTGPITSVGNATSIASQTGTGTKFVVDTGPTLVTPVLGVATATSINKLTLTQPATGSTLTIQDGFTLTVNGNATVSGTHSGTSSGTNTGDQTSVTGNAGTVTVADAGNDTTTWVLLGTSQTGSLSPATDADITYNALTGALTATTFVGALSGNATTSSSTTGNAATATALQNARTIGGTSFDGTANIVPSTITIANEAADATCFIGFFTAATGGLQPKTNAGLTYDSTTSILSATGFSGPLTGNVTGNVSGSSGSCTGNSATSSSCTGNAATATALATPRAIGGSNFDGTAAISIVATTVANEATDTTCFPLFATAATGDLGLKSNASLTFNSNTANLACTTFTGALVGNASTASSAATLTTARAIGGVNFDGSAAITPNNITAANDVTNATYYPAYFSSATGAVQPKTNVGFTVNPSTNTVTASTFVGNLTGNVTGNVSGSSGSCTGNAATVTTNANLTGQITSTGNAAVLDKTAITGQVADASPDGANDYVLTYDASATSLKKVLLSNLPAGGGIPTAITVANEATDTTCFPLFVTAATGDLGPKSNASLTFDSSTGSLACTTFVGSLTGASTSCSGNASTVTTNANLTGQVTSTGNAAVLDKTAITAQTADASPDAANDYILTYDASATSLKKVLIQNLPAGASSTITIATESTDTTCFPSFFTASSGTLQPCVNTSLTFNSNTANLACTTFTGNLVGNASTVTTNANLTGEITSTGNAAVLDKTAITNRTEDTLPDTAADFALVYDASATALKKVLLTNVSPQLGLTYCIAQNLFCA